MEYLEKHLSGIALLNELRYSNTSGKNIFEWKE